MTQIFYRNDSLAGITQANKIVGWLERAAFFFLCLMVAFAPHSIAASQTSFILGIFITFIRLFVKPRPQFPKTKLDIALWGLFLWSVLICFFAYYPFGSADKLRSVGLFLIFYFVIVNMRTLRALRFLILTLIFSCMVSVLWTPIERIFGRGVEIHGISPESPLKKALLWDGDTLLKANGIKIKTPAELVAEIEKSETTKVDFYRPDFYFTVEVKRADLESGDAIEKLGISSWKKSRNWRAQGFFSHYATFAEVLQLIVSFVLGLFVASINMNSKNDKGQIVSTGNGDHPASKHRQSVRKTSILPFQFSPVLLFCLIAMSIALLLTVTRASQLSFMISAVTIVLLSGNRKIIFTLALIILPVGLAGLFFLQQSRQVGFFDKTDDSTTYRMTVYREGINLWLDNPRHFFFGVGMDAVTKKEFRERWHLFDNGRLPVGHFHSTPIQLLVDRGLFALILWLLIFFIFLRTMFVGLRKLKRNAAYFTESTVRPESHLLPFSAGQLRIGVILGCIGATVGFLTSSLVHYNFGDGEVVMVLFVLFGFGMFAANFEIDESNLPGGSAN